MKMKKLLSGFVATTILASSLSLSAFAAVVDGEAINVQASIPDAAAAYGAGYSFNVDVDATNAPEAGFDMYEFYLKYDSSKVDFTGEDHIDEQGYVDVEEITVAEGDDLAQYIGTGSFVHVLYMNDVNVDVTHENDLGSYPFEVLEDATDGNVEFKVYDFNAGQYAAHEPATEGEFFDVVTYEMGTSTTVSVTVDTTKPVFSGLKSSYIVGDTVSGTITDSTGVSLTYLKDGEGEEPVDVDVVEGEFSIENLEAGSYILMAIDAALNVKTTTFTVLEAAEKLDVQISMDKTAYKAGDTVEMSVTANFDQIAPEGVMAFQVNIPFDSNKLEFVGIKEAVEGLWVNVTTTDEGTAVMSVYTDDTIGMTPFQGNNLGTYQFKLLGSVEDDDATLSVKSGKEGTMAAVIDLDDDGLPILDTYTEYYLDEDAVSAPFMLDSVLPVIKGVDSTEYNFGDIINLNVTDTYLTHVVITMDQSGEAIYADNGVVNEELQVVPGNYTIEAYDAAGNVTTTSFTVAEPEALAIAPEMVGTTTGYPSEDGIFVNYSSNLLAATNNVGAEAISFDVTYDPSVYDYVGFTSDVAGMEVYEYAHGYLSVVCFGDSEEGMGSINAIKTDDLLSLQFANVGANGNTAISTSNVLAASVINRELYELETADVADVSAVGVAVELQSMFLQAGGDSVGLSVTASANTFEGYNLAGYQFDLVFDTDKFELVIDPAYDDMYYLTDTGATFLYFIEGDEGATMPISTVLANIAIKAKDVEGLEGIVTDSIRLANVNLTYESTEGYAVPVCVVGDAEVAVQYAINEDGLNIVEVPDGDEMVPAVQFPLGTTQEEAEAMLEAAGLDAEITEYGSGNTMTVNGEEMHMIVMGDIDGNGEVNILDLVAGKVLIFQEADLVAADQCKQAAMDVDFNDANNVADLLKIKLFILNV